VKDGNISDHPSDLKDLGIPVEKIDSRTFRLFEKDRVIPIYITNSINQGWALTTGYCLRGEYLRGKKQLLRTVFKYQLLLAYWGGALGSRVAEVSGQPRKDPSQYSNTEELVKARDVYRHSTS
jgi:hypothetical protein